MGAITAYHKDIRHLNKDMTHVKLSFDHDDNCRIFILQATKDFKNKFKDILFLLLSDREYKDIFNTERRVKDALDVAEALLTLLCMYRRKFPASPTCEKCVMRMCRCSQRYKINEEMFEQLGV